ncbi:TMEM43 family protein [Pararhizobium antarcticum]|uniref:Uncharacterized protein n=1 Tax=Pararhizobium antarcticum TaxID=1798805 RepID=A0A657LQ91_9HYPH|nr:TMEM43 family protein [Pararhizobium antarcticum]OJF95073.1 hypothetical protein AX760_04410 [Pararhizobium antarcticum]OJF98105.1 hypothetical protein AX761_12880 [Rhizobium sp. 58]
MSFTETTTTSWFSRLKSGLVGLLIGPLLVLGMIWLLSWNEGRSVQTYRALAEGAGIVVSVDNGAIDPANEGKLIHVSGPVKPDGTPEDPMFGVAADGAAGIERKVEMFQWEQQSESKTETKLGGGEETVTTYSYRKTWRSSQVDSSDFRIQDGHQNPQMPFENERFTVESATIGAFTVDGAAVANLGEDSAVKLTPDAIARIRAALGTDRPVNADGVTVYVSQNRQNPAIGDLRISFTRQDVTQASFVGAQKATTLGEYKASNGRSLFLSAAGNASSAEMFETAQSENTMITWLVRVGGLVGMFIGFAMMLSILRILADVIPFVGSIVGFGTSAIALILTLLLGPLVIAIAWIAYRPLLAIAIIAVGALLAAAILYLRRHRATPVPAPATAA